MPKTKRNHPPPGAPDAPRTRPGRAPGPAPTPAPDAGNEDHEVGPLPVTVERLYDLFDGKDDRPKLGRNACRILLQSLRGARKIKTKKGVMAWVAPPEAWEAITPELIEAARGEQQRPAETVRIAEAGEHARALSHQVTEVEARARIAKARAIEADAEAEAIEAEARLAAVREARERRLNPAQERTTELVALIDKLTAPLATARTNDPGQVAIVAELRAELRSLREQMERERGAPREDIMAALMKTAIERLATPPAQPPMFQPADAVNLVKTLRDVAQPEGTRAMDSVVSKVVEIGLGRLDASQPEAAPEKWWQEPLAGFLGGLGEAITSGLSGLASHPTIQDLIARKVAELATTTPEAPARPAPSPKAEAQPPPPPAPEPKPSAPDPFVNLRSKLFAISEAAPERIGAECAALSRDAHTMFDPASIASLVEGDPDHVVTNLVALRGNSFADPRIRIGIVRFQAYEKARVAAEVKKVEAPT